MRRLVRGFWNFGFRGGVTALVVMSFVSCAGGPSGESSFSDADRERLEGYWRAYRQDEEDWPQIREQWLAEGPANAGVLVESVLRDFVESFDRSDLSRHERARSELVALSPQSIPFLVEALLPAEDVVRKQLSDVLSLIGEPAVEPLSGKLSDRDPEVRRVSIVTLRNIGHPSAGPGLSRMLEREPEWKVRAEIPEALSDLLGKESLGTLTGALRRDPDSFVRRRIATAMTSIGERDSVGPLVQALVSAQKQQTEGSGSSEKVSEDEWIALEREKRHLCEALERLTGQPFGYEASRWIAWWERRG